MCVYEDEMKDDDEGSCVVSCVSCLMCGVWCVVRGVDVSR